VHSFHKKQFLPHIYSTKHFFIKRWIFLLILIPYIVWSFLTYKDFGITVDEPIEYGFGEMLYNRNFGRDPLLLKDFAYEGKDSREIWAYNHFHTMLLYIFNDTGSIENYHLLNLLFFSLSLYVAYELVFQFSRNSKLSLLGPIILLLTPRLIGDIPANVKDPVFSTYYLFGLLAIVLAPKIKNNFIRLIFLGVSFGLAASMRILGYGLLFVYLVLKLIDIFHKRDDAPLKKILNLGFELTIIFSFSLLVHAIQMPFVASNPTMHLLRLMEVSKDYPWRGPMLYLGQVVQAGQLPWHYPLVWSAVITPLFILFFGLIGIFRFSSNKVGRILALSLLVNYALYYLIKQNIYDGVRHLLFTLAIMSVLAAITWTDFWIKRKKLRKWLLLSFVINVFLVGHQFLKLHPYEYIYFNEFVSYLPGAYNKFETDYWGASYLEASKWLLEKRGNRGGVVALCGKTHAGRYFNGSKFRIVLLPNCDISEKDDLNYIFSYGKNNEWTRFKEKEIYSVSRQGVPLVKIFEL